MGAGGAPRGGSGRGHALAARSVFLPLYSGCPTSIRGRGPAEVSQDALLQYKSAYLNVPFFIFRAAAYLISWCVLSFLLARWSREQDEDGPSTYATSITPTVYRGSHGAGTHG